MLGATFFLTFAVATAVALAWPRSVVLRRLYLVGFFAALLVPGLLGGRYWLWPFQTWHLWGGLQPREGTFEELLLADAAGTIYLYDRRAVAPLLDTQVHWLARHLLVAPTPPSAASPILPADSALPGEAAAEADRRARELAHFLLARANWLRTALRAGERLPPMLAFPAREHGRQWSPQEVAGAQPFVRVIARRVHFRFADARQAATTTVLVERSFP